MLGEFFSKKGKITKLRQCRISKSYDRAPRTQSRELNIYSNRFRPKMNNCLRQRFSNGAPQGLTRCATLAFRKFTTCFLHYLFLGVYKNDHLEVVRYPTLQLLQPYSWHKTLFLTCCST